MLATGCCCCCWCSWPFKKAASGKETPCYWRVTATAAAAVPTKTRPSRTGKHHGPEGGTDEQSPKYACPGAGTSLLKSPTKSLLYVSGCWLAAGCCTAAVALTAASACVCCCLLMPAAACCCLLLPAAACCLLLPAAPCCCLLLVLLLVAAAAAVVLLLCCCNQTARLLLLQ